MLKRVINTKFRPFININESFLNAQFQKMQNRNPDLKHKDIQINDYSYTPITSPFYFDINSQYKIKFPLTYEIQKKFDKNMDYNMFNKPLILHMVKVIDGKEVLIGYVKQNVTLNDVIYEKCSDNTMFRKVFELKDALISDKAITAYIYLACFAYIAEVIWIIKTINHF